MPLDFEFDRKGGVAELGMNAKIPPALSPLPKGEGIGVLAPFCLGRRVGDKGKSSAYSATPKMHIGSAYWEVYLVYILKK